MSIKLGFGQKKITPKEEHRVYLDGYAFRGDYAKGVRDDLYAKACLIEDKENIYVLLNLDICGLGKEIYELLLDYIEGVGIERRNIIFTSTHTHAGPACGVLKGLEINYDYWKLVGKLLQELIKETRQELEEGYFTFNSRDDLNIGLDRRFNKEIDRQMKVLSFYNQLGELKGLIVRVSCHPVIETRHIISADYISVLNRESLVPALFIQGNSGEINPRYSEMDIDLRLEKVGQEVFEKMRVLVSKDGESFVIKGLRLISENIVLPMKAFPKLVELEKKEQEAKAKFDKEENPVMKKINKRELDWYRGMLEKKKKNIESDLDIMVQILFVEGVNKRLVFVFLPFELFFSTTKKLYKGIRESDELFVIGSSNLTVGYLIPSEICQLGGYEVDSAPMWYDTACFSLQSEKVLLDHLFTLL